MNEKFFALPEEKQMDIINAAMEVFSKNEYKRASTDLMAAKAGVSKGLLFYYFHNKKELYFYIYDYAVKIVEKQIDREEFLSITDFFDLLRFFTDLKVPILRKNPYIMDFAMRAFFTDKEEVSDGMQQLLTSQKRLLYEQYMGHIDKSKFRKDADPYRVFNMLQWMADGYLHDLKMSGVEPDIDALKEEFELWMDMLKKLTYKEEYLHE